MSQYPSHFTMLSFNANLNDATTNDTIQALKYMLGEIDIMPENFPLKEGNFKNLLRGDNSKILGLEVVCTSIVKNYCNEVEKFLEWILPFINTNVTNNEYACVMVSSLGNRIKTKIYKLDE